jgi:uncharacterized membrane protein YeaQ/YmgE (transglycosylase-associated protein family)
METLAAIIAWAIFGLIIGAVARLLVPGRQPMGMLMTMVLGIVGSLAGGMISWIFRGGEPSVYEPAGWIMSTIGAIIVVLLFLRIGRRTE